MAFHVKDPETDRIVRQLAKVKGKGITEAIREAAANELQRAREAIPLDERIKQLQAEIRAKSGPNKKPADKAFFDWLSGEED